jgi:hypothetical protein
MQALYLNGSQAGARLNSWRSRLLLGSESLGSGNMAVTSRTRHSVRSFLWVPRTCSLLKQREAAWVQFMKNRHARYEQHQKFQ